jgi:hypothetical protein
MRVSPLIIPERWDPPAKPEASSTAALDAYRQVSFQLAPDSRLVAEGMNLQLQVLRDSSPSRYRTSPLAAMAMYWSRAFHAMSDTALLVSRGAYVSCPALVRVVCESIAAEHQAGGEEHELFLSWLTGALGPNEQHKATEVGLGTYFAGSTLADHTVLGLAYRAAAELSRQHFGAALVEVASESNRDRLLVTFGDQTFHFAWAQLILGWLLTLIVVQLDFALAAGSPFFVAEETRAATSALAERVATTLDEPSRCRIEELVEDGRRRFMLVNFRRQSTGAPRRLLL